MGKVCFSKCFRYTCLAAVTLAAAFLAAIAFANPASAAGETGRGNDLPLKEWDTDNLSRWVSSSFGRAGARNYQIPYHNYRASGYKKTVPAKACVGYNVRHPPNGATVLKYRLLPQSETTGQCPSGYSLVTQVCGYRGHEVFTDYSGGTGKWPSQGYQHPTYRPVNSQGTGDRLSYTGATCDPSSYGTYSQWACSPVARSLSGSLVSVPHAEVCRDRYGRFSLRRFTNDCAAAYAHRVALHPGCQSAVADAFFQTGGTTGAVNDFPVASYGSESQAGRIAATGRRDRGCVEFAEQQDRLVSSMNGNGGWYFDSEGNLRKNAGEVPSRVLSRPAAVYGTWAAKGSNYYHLARYHTATTSPSGEFYRSLAADDSSYDLRADQRESLDVGGAPLWERVLATVAEKWNTRGNCSAVIGATHPADIQRAREIAGHDMVFLVPGIGAQGGDAKAVAQADPFANLVINSSRSITNSPHPNQAAANLHRQINQAADS